MCEIQFVVLLYAKLHRFFFTANTSSSSAPELKGRRKHKASLRQVYCQGDFFLAFGQRQGIFFFFSSGGESMSRVAECLTILLLLSICPLVGLLEG